MVEPVALDVYDNGWKAVQGEEEYYVETPSGERVEFGSASVRSHRYGTRAFAALCTRFGELPVVDESRLVPVEVAVAGKPEIATYVYAVYGARQITPGYRHRKQRAEEIAAYLDISVGTIYKYRRRVMREVQDRKVGGRAR